MAYAKIPNLYRTQNILHFKKCYALEKIHGSSTHVGYNNGQLNFFSGGLGHFAFIDLFDKAQLKTKFEEVGSDNIVVYGEGYGGKCQSMQETYGDDIKFVAFEVKIDDNWLDVANAYDVAHNQLGFDFVDWKLIPCDMEHIDAERDRPSVQAQKCGMGKKEREGIVLKPPIEVKLNNGKRVYAKHKNKAFQERQNQPSPQEVDPKKLKKMKEAKAIANEWVTRMRLTHVLDGFGNPTIEDTGEVIEAMREDIKKEAEGEIAENDRVWKEVGSKTAELFQERLGQFNL